VRIRRAAAAGDEAAGLALTGIVSCLVSPVTWIHHLVWLIPALVLLVVAGAGASGRRRWWPWGLAAVSYAILCSKLVWPFDNHFDSVGGYLGSNAYVLIALVLLVATPIRSAQDAVAQPGIAEGGASRGPHLTDSVRP